MLHIELGVFSTFFYWIKRLWGTISKNEKIVNEKFGYGSRALDDDDASDIPPMIRKRNHVVEKPEKHPFQYTENNAAQRELPALFHHISLGGTRIDEETELQECRARNHRQGNRIENVDADPEALVTNDVDPEIQQPRR